MHSDSIILIMTDDQDTTLGGLTPMKQMHRLLREEGAVLSNFFVTTPVCCPSRTATLTGQFAHNLDDQHKGWCGTFRQRENNTFALWLQQSGYQTGLFGKYYNAYGDFCGKNIHVPHGWDRWFSMCDDNKFFSNSFNDQGKMVKHGTEPSDYMTSVIGNQTIAWLKEVAAQNKPDKSGEAGSPFFAYVAVHAPHVPATPAPWYNNSFPGQKAPRTPNYNYHAENHPWLISSRPELTDALQQFSDDLFLWRWRSLLSVDDLVAAIIETLGDAGVLENTYIMYTSDHGYNLGQFRLPSGKFHVYEHDIRVPMLVRGPGISPNSTITGVCSNVDLAATILDLAKVEAKGQLDGKSMVPLFSQTKASGAWRDRMLIEYWGLGYVWRGPCRHGVSPCPGNEALEDAPSNTYSALRIINETMDYLYADYRPRSADPTPAGANFTEMYDLQADPYQLTNLAADPRFISKGLALKRELYHVITCTGAECP